MPRLCLLPCLCFCFVTLHLRLTNPQEGSFILYDEATLTPPDNATLLDEEALAPIRNASGAPANASAMPTNVSATPAPFCDQGATSWMGCVIVTVPAIMSERGLECGGSAEAWATAGHSSRHLAPSHQDNPSGPQAAL